uniref:Uncharacterized protein n=1 Tax=Arundo donax TaxID=35708 RepID=A0A0A9CHB2_ARUDO
MLYKLTTDAVSTTRNRSFRHPFLKSPFHISKRLKGFKNGKDTAAHYMASSPSI